MSVCMYSTLKTPFFFTEREGIKRAIIFWETSCFRTC
jgi:hypothetical protein